MKQSDPSSDDDRTDTIEPNESSSDKKETDSD